MIIKSQGRSINLSSPGLKIHREKSSPWVEFYTTASTPNPVSITTRMPVGQSLYMDWGDGITDEVVGTGSNITSQHTYVPAVPGTRIRINGDSIQNIRYFSIYNQRLEGQHPIVDGFGSLITLWLRANSLTGPIPAFSGCTALTLVWHKNTPFTSIAGAAFQDTPNLREIWINDGGQLTGDIPSISGLNNLKIAYFDDNKFTGFAGGMVATGVNFNAANNLLTQEAVDLILSDAVAAGMGSGDTIQVHGTGNSPPSSQGYIDRDTLVANGAIVYVN